MCWNHTDARAHARAGKHTRACAHARTHTHTHTKYLGIHFDSRLLFYKHIEQVAEKSRALTYMLIRTAKLHWGFGHKSLKTVYGGWRRTSGLKVMRQPTNSPKKQPKKWTYKHSIRYDPYYICSQRNQQERTRNSGSYNGTTRRKEQCADPSSQTWCRG